MKAPGGSDPQGASAQGAGSGQDNGAAREGAAGIATALTQISERATLLIHEEIELAKAEVTQKLTRLARGTVVSVAAGVFILTALMFALVGCAWLLYYYLPVGNQYTYFYGFFAMAVILLVLGIFAGLIAARVLRSSTPPVPEMAIEEARKIRDTVSNGSDPDRKPPPAWSSASATTGGQTPPSGMAPASAPAPPIPAAPVVPPPEPAPDPVPRPASTPTIDEAALAADPTADASRVPTDELGPPLEQSDAGEGEREAS